MREIEEFESMLLKRDKPKGFRTLKSGIIGIVKGQTARIHVINSGPPTSIAKSAWVQGFKNPKSELLAQSVFSLDSGTSAYLDLRGDMSDVTSEGRLQVHAVVTLLDDVDASCLATLEVFDNATKRTMGSIPLIETSREISSEYYRTDKNTKTSKDSVDFLNPLFSKLMKGDASRTRRLLRNFLDELKTARKLTKKKLKEKNRELTHEDLIDLVAAMNKSGVSGMAIGFFIASAISEISGGNKTKTDESRDDKQDEEAATRIAGILNHFDHKDRERILNLVLQQKQADPS